MADRDKVIKGLGEALEVIGTHVPERFVGYSAGAILDAIEMLKAQEEPHVLSREDILAGVTPDVIWAELKGNTMLTPGVWQIDHYEMGEGSVLDALDDEVRETGNYGVHWRVWTARPTISQREATPWE